MRNYFLRINIETVGAKIVKNAKNIDRQRLKVIEHNLCYNKKQAKFVLKSINTNENLFKLCYYKQLDYIVPYAIQSNSILSFGLNDELLANTFESPSFDIADDIHLCIFPLQNKSVIFIFCRTDIDIYDSFFKELKERDISEQLSILNFITFAYFEDIFLHQSLDTSVLNNNPLQTLSQEQTIVITDRSIIKKMPKNKLDKLLHKSLKKNFSISNHSKIPNLLDEKHKIDI